MQLQSQQINTKSSEKKYNKNPFFDEYKEYKNNKTQSKHIIYFPNLFSLNHHFKLIGFSKFISVYGIYKLVLPSIDLSRLKLEFDLIK